MILHSPIVVVAATDHLFERLSENGKFGYMGEQRTVAFLDGKDNCKCADKDEVGAAVLVAATTTNVPAVMGNNNHVI